jgi:hypothetical protein
MMIATSQAKTATGTIATAKAAADHTVGRSQNQMRARRESFTRVDEETGTARLRAPQRQIMRALQTCFAPGAGVVKKR